MSRAGAAVRVIAMHAPGAAVHETLEGIEVIRPRYMPRESWEILRREGGGLPIIWRRNKLARLLFVPFGVAHVLAIARWARDCDVVHANWTLSALAAVLARPIHRRSVVATLQGSDVFQVTRSRLGRWLTAATLRACDRVLVLSRALAQATARTGIAVDRLTVVPNGVDTGRFIPAPAAERDRLILFVGSLIPRKGANYLIEALPAVLATLPGYRLVILGDGPDEQALRVQAAALGIADRIDMQGFLPQAEVVAAMRLALAVCPAEPGGRAGSGPPGSTRLWHAHRCERCRWYRRRCHAGGGPARAARATCSAGRGHHGGSERRAWLAGHESSRAVAGRSGV